MPRSSRWPDHAAIGTCYILLAIMAGLVGGALSLSLKLPAMMDAGPGLHETWRAAALRHGPMLMFFSAIPALLGGFGNWFVPLMIGARDTALPRLGFAAFCLTTTGFVMTLLGLLPGASMPLLLGGAHVAGVGLLLCAFNLLATLLTMRADGMRLGALPLFAWSQLIACCLTVMALPMLLAVLTMFALHEIADDRVPPLLRMLAAPGLGIMILPGFGLTAEIVASLGGRAFVGRTVTIVAMTSFAAAGYLIWAQWLLHGMALASSTVLPLLVMLPVVVMAGCWAATLCLATRPRMLLRVPGLFAFGFVLLLTGGGLYETAPHGVAALMPQPLHDLPSLAAMFAVFAGFYYWIGRMSGRPYPDGLGRLQFWLLAAGAMLGLSSMPMLAAAGSALTSLSILLFALIVVMTLSRRRSLVANPCDPVASTLEWRLPTAGRTGR